MGLIKEYVDRAVQTEVDTVLSPYADPAVVLAAPLVTRRGAAQETHTRRNNSISALSVTGSDSAHASPQSPTSPMLAPLVSRRLSKRRSARCPTGEIVNRRIASMPENWNDPLPRNHEKRVVSMPDRVRTALGPSPELFQSPSSMVGDSFGSCGSCHERVRVFCAPSDVPQTPSPPSSPESLLIIASGAQLPEGFLRRKFSPELLIEEDEDWVTWANSPPRPIPALHGPLSLPYARCPSGAEGTIIEEPDNVAQMIWGLDDQPHNQIRAEGPLSHYDNSQDASSHESGQVPPRLQKKRTSVTQQVPKLSRIQTSYTSHAKQSLARAQRQAHDDKRSSLCQVSPDMETRQVTRSGVPWDEKRSLPVNVGAPDNFVDDVDVFPVDNDHILEWQFARLRQTLTTSLADMDSYAPYPRRLEPIMPAAAAPGLPQSYPRIFVEPRHNEPVSSATRQSQIEIAQQYRQQQLYRQALQKQKLQVQNLLPTPPNSSSPRWSSHFSPYLTYCSTFSPELAGSTEHAVPALSQKYRSGASASQCLRHVYDQRGHDNVNKFDSSTNILSANTPQIVPNVPSLRQSSSSTTLAKYIKQLQALTPIAQLSPAQPAPLSDTSLPPLLSTGGPFRTVYHSPAISTPPSPESPYMPPRGSLYHGACSMAPSRPMQRLASVPEEDNALLEPSTSVSPSQSRSQVATDSISSGYNGTTGHEIRFVDVMRKCVIPDLPDFENSPGPPPITFHHETSPVKVRLPVTKEHDIRERTSGYHEQNKGHQHGHRKKHRYKKLKGPAITNEQAMTRDLVGQEM